jgi:ASC-1-like (ASCH) protein
MEYKKHLSEPWFSLIKLKLKKCEGRLNKGDFSKMKEGDIIEFYNEDFDIKRKYKVKITKVNHYTTFKKYLENESLKKCLPGIDNINEGLKIYFKYYSKENEKKYNIVAIRFKLI